MRKEEHGNNPEKGSKPKIDWKALEIVHPDAAGIDVGGSGILREIKIAAVVQE